MRGPIAALALAIVTGFQTASAAAVQCDKLQPIPPQDVDRTFTGKVNAAVDGWFAKLAKVGGDVEGNYRDVSNNVLPQFPQADRLYVWERVLYLKCQLIAESTDLSTQDKLHAVDDLSRDFTAPPPAAAAAPNTIDNSGNNANFIQGHDNSINVGK